MIFFQSPSCESVFGNYQKTRSDTRRRRARGAALLLLIPCLLLLLPPPVAQGFGAFSVGEEKEVGEKLLSIVRKQFPIVDEPDIEQYINKIGHEVLEAAGPQYFHYHFFVVNDKEFNAFAAPSGLIFFHSAIFETISDENELVSVLAHECAHVTSRHIAERIAQMTKVNIGTLALALAGLAVGGGDLSQAVVTGAMAAGASAGLHFSRQNEEEADRLAYNWMLAMNRDPKAMATVLEKMRRITQYRKGNLPSYLLSHPETDKRVGYVQDLIGSGGTGSYQNPDPFEYQRIRNRILSLTRDPEIMKTRYLKKIANPEEEVMARYGLSQVYLQSANYGQAEVELKKVMGKFPGKPELKTDLALIYQGRGEVLKALVLLKEAYKEDPQSYFTAFTLGLALEQSGDLGGALAQYEQLLPNMPDNSKLYYHIGQVKAARKEEGEAYYFLGMHKWLEGEAEAAKRQLAKALTLLPAESPYREKTAKLVDTINRVEKIK